MTKFNIAYIDAANLDQALRHSLCWKLDYKKFRKWLKDKYNVDRAYIFIGLIPKHKDLYTYLQNCGFTLVFKDVLMGPSGKPKGNCDSDLLAQAFKDLYEGDLEKAVLVSSDGDYAPLIKALKDKGQILTVFSPAKAKFCSLLIKRIGVPIAYLNDQRSKLEKM